MVLYKRRASCLDLPNATGFIIGMLIMIRGRNEKARIVPKRTGEHAQIEKRFINPRTSGCIRVSK